MKRTAVLAALAFCFSVATWAQAAGPGFPGPHRRGPMAGRMAEVVGPELMAACHADLETLGAPEEVRKAFDDKRFELQKKTIPAMAELRVLQLELDRLLGQKDFDLTVAQKIVGDLAVKKSEIRANHVELLHQLGSVLTEDQWLALRAPGQAPCPDCSKRGPCPNCPKQGKPAGRDPCRCEKHGRKHGAPCDKHRMGGMMHRHGADTPKEAEEFFKGD